MPCKNEDNSMRKMKSTPAQKKNRLNVRQERFCVFVAASESHTYACIKAGFKTTKSAARRAAARLLTNADILKRITELRKPITRKTLSTRYHKREMLYLIMEDKTEKIDVLLKAIVIDAKLAGQFEPDRKELQLANHSLQSIKERAAEVGYALARSCGNRTPAKLDD